MASAAQQLLVHIARQTKTTAPVDLAVLRNILTFQLHGTGNIHKWCAAWSPRGELCCCWHLPVQTAFVCACARRYHDRFLPVLVTTHTRYRQIAVQTFVMAEVVSHRPRTWEHLVRTALQPKGKAEPGPDMVGSWR